MFSEEVDSVKLNQYLHEIQKKVQYAYEFDGVRYVRTDQEFELVGDSIQELMYEFFQCKGSYDYSIDIKHVGDVCSSDGKVRIINWNFQYSDKTYTYFGFVMHKVRNGDVEVYRLTDSKVEVRNFEDKVFAADNWYGALYYFIMPAFDGKKKRYILFGWDGNDQFSTKKIIDVLSFKRSGEPEFGDNIFVKNNRKNKRLVFEYSSKVNMLLRYDEEEELIVFDHLTPIKNSFKGNYQFYGPDGTYDAFKMQNSYWVFQDDVILKNKDLQKKSSTEPSGSDQFYKK